MKKFELILLSLMIMIIVLLISCKPSTQPVIIPEPNLTAPTNTTTNTTNASQPEVEINNTGQENKTENNTLQPEENVTREKPESPSDEEINNCKSTLNERCIGSPGLECTGNAELDLGKKTITFSARNNLSYDIELTGLEWFIEDEEWKCITIYEVENTYINVDGSGFVNIIKTLIIPAGQVFDIRIKLSSVDKGYVDQRFDLNFIGHDKEQIGNFRLSVIG